MDLFAGADVSSAGGARESSGAFPGRGTHVPPQGGSFAWRTDEWYLAPETLMPTKGRAGASEHVYDSSSAARVVGSALTAPLVAAVPGARVGPPARVGFAARRPRVARHLARVTRVTKGGAASV